MEQTPSPKKTKQTNQPTKTPHKQPKNKIQMPNPLQIETETLPQPQTVQISDWLLSISKIKSTHTHTK